MCALPFAFSKWPGATLPASARIVLNGAGVLLSLGVQGMKDFPWLSVITFVPIIGALILSGLGSADRRLVRPLSLAFALIPLALTILICCRFDTASPDLQFVERH